MEMKAKNEGVGSLVWEDLMVVLRNRTGPTRRLLNGLTGYALQGRILAVMGPSGSGKSTFLDTLAGRLSVNAVKSGSISLNGRRRKLNDSIGAYVTQECGFLGTLTVRETLAYSAKLRFRKGTTRDELNEAVESTISEMGLQDCADTIIGNWHRRGISGGEKRRLGIGLEIITQPSVLLLDEPTSGLDSAASFFVVQTLRSLALSGRTIISSIHQPNSEVFGLFHDLLLLSNGQTIYFGEAGKAVEFFAEAGFPCPTRRNPSDHFLVCINSDFDSVRRTLKDVKGLTAQGSNSNGSAMYLPPTAEIRARLIQKYQSSKYAPQVIARAQELSTSEGSVLGELRASQAAWLTQLKTLTNRSFINMNRDIAYYWVRILCYIAVSVSVGTIFYNTGQNYIITSVQDRGAAEAFIFGMMTIMVIGGFPSIIEEMKVFNKERLNRHYGVGVYILSNCISSFPFLVGISCISTAITYYMMKYHSGFSHFAFFTLDFFLSVAFMESCMLFIAAFTPNFLMCILFGSSFAALMVITSGYFRSFPDLPSVFWKYPVYYINYLTWALQGALKNELMGVEFKPLQQGQPKIPGERVIRSWLKIPMIHSKWWDLVAIAALLVASRLLFFFTIKFKESFMPIYRSFCAKKTIHQLRKKPPFRSTPQPFSSKRHEARHTLASQEGLSSPLH